MTSVNLATQRRLQNLVNHVAQNYVLSKPVLLSLRGHQKLASLSEQQTTDHNSTSKPTPQKPTPVETPTAATTGEEALNHVFKILQSGDYERVRKSIFDLIPYLDEGNDMRRAYRLVGLSYYRNNEFSKALAWFHKAAKTSDSINDWFNLCSCAAQAGQSKIAMDAFQKVEELHKASNFQLKPSFWIQLYWFLISLINGQHYALAFQLLDRLKNAYQRVRFMDKEYLEEIGLPSFEEFLATTTSLFSRVGNLQDCKEYLESMSNFLDDTGKKMLSATLDSLFKPKEEQNASKQEKDNQK